MSKGGGGGNQDVTQTTEPWSGAQPYLLDMYKQASNLYNQGGPAYYPESTVTPFSPQSQLGMGMMEKLALGGSQYQQPLDQLYAQLMKGSANNPGLNYLQGFSNATVNPRQIKRAQVGFAPQVQVGNGLTDPTRQALNQTQAGAYLNSNPYLDQTYNRASNAVTRQFNESVLPGVNSTFSLAGRTGSGVHQNAVNQASEQLGTTLSDLGNQVYGGNYQQERDRMLQASNALGGFDTQAQGYGLQASSQNAQNALSRNINQANLAQDASRFNATNDMNAQQFNQGFRLDMGNALNGMYQQGINNQVSGASLGQNMMGNEWDNISRLMGVGGMVEDKAGQYLQDNKNRFDYYQQRPYQNMNQLTSWISGNPASNLQSSNSNYDQNDGSAFGNFAGNALMAAIPYIFSDINLKSGVKFEKEVNGFNWYSWTWNDNARRLGLSGDAQGVIAQEVERTRPDLVVIKDGYKAVNYAGVLYGIA